MSRLTELLQKRRPSIAIRCRLGDSRKPMSPVTAAAMCRSSRASHRSHQKGRCARTVENWSAARACTKQRQAGPGLRLRRCSTYTCAVGLARASAKRVSLALGCVTGFHSENRRFRSARGGSREGGRAFEGAHGKDTDRGGGRSSHLPPPRERPTGGGVRSTSGADHRPAGGSPRSRGGGYKVTLV